MLSGRYPVSDGAYNDCTTKKPNPVRRDKNKCRNEYVENCPDQDKGHELCNPIDERTEYTTRRGRPCNFMDNPSEDCEDEVLPKP